MNRSFIRKLIYIVIIAGLLVPLSYYSQPAVLNKNNQLVGGGKLAQLRQEYEISESSLGEFVSRTGGTIRCCTWKGARKWPTTGGGWGARIESSDWPKAAPLDPKDTRIKNVREQ